MALEGGLRDRMIHESLGRHIEADLTTRGWFAAGRDHAALNVITGFPNDTAEVALNTIAFSVEERNREMRVRSAREMLHMPDLTGGVHTRIWP